MTQLLELTKDARTLITKGWTQGAAARNDKGDEVEVEDSTACQYCMLGAFNAALVTKGMKAGDPLISKFASLVSNFIGGYFVTEFNDTHTKEEVLEVFDKVIKLLEEV